MGLLQLVHKQAGCCVLDRVGNEWGRMGLLQLVRKQAECWILDHVGNEWDAWGCCNWCVSRLGVGSERTLCRY